MSTRYAVGVHGPEFIVCLFIWTLKQDQSGMFFGTSGRSSVLLICGGTRIFAVDSKSVRPVSKLKAAACVCVFSLIYYVESNACASQFCAILDHESRSAYARDLERRRNAVSKEKPNVSITWSNSMQTLYGGTELNRPVLVLKAIQSSRVCSRELREPCLREVKGGGYLENT
jgi:hypothetical protein